MPSAQDLRRKRKEKRRQQLADQRAALLPRTGHTLRFHVIVTSYDRPADLLRLLRDIASWSSGFKVDVSVYDDYSPSDIRRSQALAQAMGWSFRQSPKRNGKEGYANWLGQILRDELKSSSASLFVLLQDDIRLCSNFFEQLSHAWSGLGRRGAIQLYRDSRADRPHWTTMKPKRTGSFIRVGWVDCVFACDRETARCIVADPPKIDRSRWQKNPKASSGFGSHVSHLFERRGIPMFAPARSLVAHVGFNSSKMHPGEREKHPLRAIDFADGEPIHKALLRREPVIAGMASIPSREPLLAAAVESLALQVDELRIYLNGYSSVPRFLRKNPKVAIYVHASSEHGDLGDAGKFFEIEDQSGYYLSCDDDLVYPPDYAVRMIGAIERYGRRAIVCAHGSVLPPRPSSYFRDRRLLHYGFELRRDTPVHVAGTGVTAFHTDTLPLVQKRDFPTGFMADIHLAVCAYRRRVPIVVIRHAKDWVRDAGATRGTLFDRYSRKDGGQTQELLKLAPWRTPSI